MQYIEALRHIHAQNFSWRPAQSIYLLFVPDKEIGGAGMDAFLELEHYKFFTWYCISLE